jgi:hypothetical protein
MVQFAIAQEYYPIGEAKMGLWRAVGMIALVLAGIRAISFSVTMLVMGRENVRPDLVHVEQAQGWPFLVIMCLIAIAFGLWCFWYAYRMWLGRSGLVVAGGPSVSASGPSILVMIRRVIVVLIPRDLSRWQRIIDFVRGSEAAKAARWLTLIFAVYGEVQLLFTGDLVTGTKDHYVFNWPTDYRVYYCYAAIAIMVGCLFMFFRHRSRIPKTDLRNVRLLALAFGQIGAGVLLLMVIGRAGLSHVPREMLYDVALWIIFAAIIRFMLLLRNPAK